MGKCRHPNWVYYLGDEGKGIGGGVAYYFCRDCKATLVPGRGIYLIDGGKEK